MNAIVNKKFSIKGHKLPTYILGYNYNRALTFAPTRCKSCSSSLLNKPYCSCYRSLLTSPSTSVPVVSPSPCTSRSPHASSSSAYCLLGLSHLSQPCTSTTTVSAWLASSCLSVWKLEVPLDLRFVVLKHCQWLCPSGTQGLLTHTQHRCSRTESQPHGYSSFWLITPFFFHYYFWELLQINSNFIVGSVRDLGAV